MLMAHRRPVADSGNSSFISRDDFEDMRSAGLNALRIPIGYWSVDVQDDEPYVTGQYPFLIQAVQWARELDLQVMIDLHGAPGSQNGQDNSGLIGPVLFPGNSSNADRSLDVIRNLTEEFSQDIYGGVVTAIELLNEPRLDDDEFPMSQLKDFYTDGADIISRASSNDINVTIHGMFESLGFNNILPELTLLKTPSGAHHTGHPTTHSRTPPKQYP